MNLRPPSFLQPPTPGVHPCRNDDGRRKGNEAPFR